MHGSRLGLERQQDALNAKKAGAVRLAIIGLISVESTEGSYLIGRDFA